MSDNVQIATLAYDDGTYSIREAMRAIKTARQCRRVVTVEWDPATKRVVFSAKVPLPKAVQNVIAAGGSE